MSSDNHSNLITPPDFLDNENKSILLIDPEPTEVEDIYLWLQSDSASINVYVYTAEMKDLKWLKAAVKKSSAVIVNTINNINSPLKDKLAEKKGTYYYGPKRFIMNQNVINAPIDYFITTTKK